MAWLLKVGDIADGAIEAVEAINPTQGSSETELEQLLARQAAHTGQCS